MTTYLIYTDTPNTPPEIITHPHDTETKPTPLHATDAPQILHTIIRWHAYSLPEQTNARWPQAEPHIIKDPHTAYFYAKHILQKRWIEAETTIKGTNWQHLYEKHFGCTL